MNSPYTIRALGQTFSITSRTLRHWESVGLIQSKRDSVSGWRIYDETAYLRIQIICGLRPFNFSLKEIAEILEADQLHEVVTLIDNHLALVNHHLNSQVQSVHDLQYLKETLKNLDATMDISELGKLLPIIQKGIPMKTTVQPRQITLPAMRMMVSSAVGLEPEQKALSPLLQWIKAMRLEGTMRLFGFNIDPYPAPEQIGYGFAYGASIPETVSIPEPFTEMHLAGGLYLLFETNDQDPSLAWESARVYLEDPSCPWQYDQDRHPGLEEHIESPHGFSGYWINVLLPVKEKNARL